MVPSLPANIDNIWEALAVLLVLIGWGWREVQHQAKSSSNGGVSEARIRALVAEHAMECPAALRLQEEIRDLRASIDRLTTYLLNRGGTL